MTRVFIYESEYHTYTWPEAGFDDDVLREQARLHVKGQRGAPEPRSTTIHHHKREQACVGYGHEEFLTDEEKDRRAKNVKTVDDQDLEEMRNQLG